MEPRPRPRERVTTGEDVTCVIRPRRGASPSTESSELTREEHGLSPTPPRTWIANEVRSRRSGDGKQDDDPGYILTPQRSPLPKGAETGAHEVGEGM